MEPGMSTGTLPGCGAMGLGKVKHNWNSIWQGILSITRAFTEYRKWMWKKRCLPWCSVNKTAKPTWGTSKCSTNLFPSVFNSNPSSHIASVPENQDQGWRSEVGPITGESQAWDGHGNAQTCGSSQGSSWTPEGMMQCPSHSPWHLTSHGRQLCVLGDRRKGKYTPILVKSRKEILGIRKWTGIVLFS